MVDEKAPESRLDLSTEALPPVIVTIDGTPYNVRTAEHLSLNEEGKLRAIIRQEEHFTSQMRQTPENEAEQEKIGKRLAGVRVKLLSMMTDIPLRLISEDAAEAADDEGTPLTAFQQNQILEIIQQGI